MGRRCKHVANPTRQTESHRKSLPVRSLRIEIIPDGTVKTLEYAGKPVTVKF